MKDVFVEQDWESLCERLIGCAKHVGDAIGRREEFLRRATEFNSQPRPQKYADLLQRVSAAAELAKLWQALRAEHQHSDEIIDEAADESFPASDPPSSSAAHA